MQLPDDWMEGLEPEQILCVLIGQKIVDERDWNADLWRTRWYALKKRPLDLDEGQGKIWHRVCIKRHISTVDSTTIPEWHCYLAYCLAKLEATDAATR